MEKRGWKGRWFGKGGKWKPYIYEAGMYLLFFCIKWKYLSNTSTEQNKWEKTFIKNNKFYDGKDI